MRLALFHITLSFAALFVAQCNYRKSKVNFKGEGQDSLSFKMIRENILVPYCLACHTESHRVSLGSYPSVVRHLAEIERTVIKEKKMPPSGPLDTGELSLLSHWIAAGAPEENAEPVEPPPPLEATFSSIHNLIFRTRCIVCHSANHTAQRVPLSTRKDLLNSPRDLVLPGNPDESALIIAIERIDDKRMPPSDSGMNALSKTEVEVIRKWILEGAL